MWTTCQFFLTKPLQKLDYGIQSRSTWAQSVSVWTVAGRLVALSEDKKIIVDTIITAFKSLSPEQRFLITMVYRQGLKQKQAAKMLGWSEYKTTRHLAKALEVMRRALEKKGGIEFTDKVSEAFAGIWRNDWNN